MTPEQRQRHRERDRKRWENPEYRARQLAGRRERYREQRAATAAERASRPRARPRPGLAAQRQQVAREWAVYERQNRRACREYRMVGDAIRCVERGASGQQMALARRVLGL